MSHGTGNPTELFSVKGMVALVCRQLQVTFFPLVPKHAVRPLVALCNASGYQALCQLRSVTPIHVHLLTRFYVTDHWWRNRYWIHHNRPGFSL